jgi:hypothetical protein
MKKRKCEQIRTRGISIQAIMKTEAFRRGVLDQRAGRKPRFDEEANGPSGGWFYERGRQFATIAPRDLQVILERRLNPAAVLFYEEHDEIL